MDNEIYQNPLITRYASREMSENFSDEKRFKLWRRLWITLAEAEMELGLNITKAQVAEMKKYADDINFEVAEGYERKLRHDVMAHVHAFGEQAKKAKPNTFTRYFGLRGLERAFMGHLPYACWAG